METRMNMAALARDDGLLDPVKIAAPLRTTVAELADSVGLGSDALQRRSRVGSPKVQTRLRELVELLNIMEPRMGGPLIAYAWLRSEPLSGWGGWTAMELLRQGKARQVRDYIDSVDAGIFA
jgi:hypothetical protein